MMTKYQVILKTGLSSKVVLRTTDKAEAESEALTLMASPYSHVKVMSRTRVVGEPPKSLCVFDNTLNINLFDSDLVLQEV
jgi:hypothetical protein